MMLHAVDNRIQGRAPKQGPGRSKSRRAIASLVCGAMALQACSVAQTSLAGYDDPSDMCNVHRKPIIESRSTEEQDRIESALIGAAAAGLVTGLIGVATGSDNALAAALVAAAAGGLAGYSLQYLKQKSEKAADQDALLRSIDSDAKNEASLVTGIGKSAAALQNCREKELKQLRADFKAKSVTREAARTRLAAIEGRIKTDNDLIAEAFESADERVGSYIDATASTVDVERDLVYTPPKTKKPSANREQRAAVRKAQRLSPNVNRTAKKNQQVQTAHAKRDQQLAQEVDAMNDLLA